MTEQTSAPATQTIKIQGFDFTIGAPYAEGHTLNANEASALNQVYGENIRNNAATKIKAAKEAAEKAGVEFSIDSKIGGEGENADKTLRQVIDEYASTYAFGARTVRSSEPADPVEREAKRIATDAVSEALRQNNVKRKDLPEGKFDEMVATAMKAEQIIKEAQRRVKQKSNIGLAELGLGLEKTAEATGEAA